MRCLKPKLCRISLLPAMRNVSTWHSKMSFAETRCVHSPTERSLSFHHRLLAHLVKAEGRPNPADSSPRQDPYSYFLRALYESSRESKCWARGCQRYGTGGQNGSKLMRCAGCRGFQYCSRDCQRVQWKEELRPHKVDCATLARIQHACSFDIVTGTPDARAFAAACSSAGITVEEFAQPLSHLSAAYSALDLSEAPGIQCALFLSTANFVLIC